MANSTNDRNEKLRQYDALTPVQDERQNERDPFVGHMPHVSRHQPRRGLLTQTILYSLCHMCKRALAT